MPWSSAMSHVCSSTSRVQAGMSKQHTTEHRDDKDIVSTVGSLVAWFDTLFIGTTGKKYLKKRRNYARTCLAFTIYQPLGPVYSAWFHLCRRGYRWKNHLPCGASGCQPGISPRRQRRFPCTS